MSFNCATEHFVSTQLYRLRRVEHLVTYRRGGERMGGQGRAGMEGGREGGRGGRGRRDD